MRLAVIPARGGSKRIPRKNIKLFGGKPMIAWSIAAALKSNCFDRVIVSTDDIEIAEVARLQGAEVPFVRPATLSDDHTATIPVIRHAIECLSDKGQTPSQVCCIYATAPFLHPADIRRGLAVIESTACDYAFSTTSYAFPIQRAIRVNKQGKVGMFLPEHANTRSQDLEKAYHDAAQFYWGQAQAWISEKSIFGANSAAVHIPRYRVQDIDTVEDWVMAEYLFFAMNLERESAHNLPNRNQNDI
jgi:N-acylneuraminate cytidylyltransferase